MVRGATRDQPRPRAQGGGVEVEEGGGGRMAGCMQGGKGREAGGRWLEDRRDGSTIRLTEGREGRRGQY